MLPCLLLMTSKGILKEFSHSLKTDIFETMSNNYFLDRSLYLTVSSRGKMRCVMKRHRPATAGPSHAVNTIRYSSK